MKVQDTSEMKRRRFQNQSVHQFSTSSSQMKTISGIQKSNQITIYSPQKTEPASLINSQKKISFQITQSKSPGQFRKSGSKPVQYQQQPKSNQVTKRTSSIEKYQTSSQYKYQTPSTHRNSHFQSQEPSVSKKELQHFIDKQISNTQQQKTHKEQDYEVQALKMQNQQLSSSLKQELIRSEEQRAYIDVLKQNLESKIESQNLQRFLEEIKKGTLMQNCDLFVYLNTYYSHLMEEIQKEQSAQKSYNGEIEQMKILNQKLLTENEELSYQIKQVNQMDEKLDRSLDRNDSCNDQTKMMMNTQDSISLNFTTNKIGQNLERDYKEINERYIIMEKQYYEQKNDIHKYKTDLNRYEHEFSVLQKKLLQAQEENSKLKNDNGPQMEKTIELNQELQAKNVRETQLIEQIQSLQFQQIEEKSQYELLKSQLSQKEKELNSVKEMHEKQKESLEQGQQMYEEKLKKFNRNLMRQTTINAELQQEIQNHNQKHHEYERRHRETEVLSHQIREQSRSIEKYQQETLKEKQEKEDAHSKLSRLQTSQKEDQEKIAYQKAQIDILETQNKEIISKLEEEQNKSAEIQKEYDDLKNQFVTKTRKAKQKILTLKQSVGTFQEQKQKLDQQLIQIGTGLKVQFDEPLDSLEDASQLQMIEQKLNEYNQRNDYLERQNKALKEQILKSEHQIVELNVKVQKHMDQIQLNEKTQKQIKQDLKVKEILNDTVNQEINKHKAKQQQMSQLNIELRSQVIILGQERDKFEELYNNLQIQLKDNQTEFENNQKKFEDKCEELQKEKKEANEKCDKNEKYNEQYIEKLQQFIFDTQLVSDLQEMAQINHDIDSLKNQKRNLAIELNNKELKLIEKNYTSASPEKNSSKKQKNNEEDLKEQISEIKAELTSYDANLKLLIGRKLQLENYLQKHQQTLKYKFEEFENVFSLNKHLQEQVSSLRNDIHLIRSSNNHLQQNFQDISEECDKLASENEKLNTERDNSIQRSMPRTLSKSISDFKNHVRQASAGGVVPSNIALTPSKFSNNGASWQDSSLNQALGK